MGDIESTKVANGQASSAEQYNQMRADILENHDHSAGKGGTLNHGDASDGRISYLSHAELNKHVQGTGTVAGGPDDPGGSQGVHGLPPTAYVMGCLVAGQIMVTGAGITDTTYSIPGATGGEKDQTTASPVSFGVTFAAAPKVVIIPRDPDSARISAYNASTTTFTPRIGFAYGAKSTGASATSFDWFAVGVLA